MRQALARCLVHPAIVCEHSMEEDLHRGHKNPLVRLSAVLPVVLHRPQGTRSASYAQIKSALTTSQL